MCHVNKNDRVVTRPEFYLESFLKGKIMKMQFIHYNNIPSYYHSQEGVMFKEFYFDKDTGEYLPTSGTNYHIVNLNNLENFILDSESQFVVLLGMVGKFFIYEREKT